MAKPALIVPILCAEASAFAAAESIYPEPSLYGVTDGKAVGHKAGEVDGIMTLP